MNEYQNQCLIDAHEKIAQAAKLLREAQYDLSFCDVAKMEHAILDSLADLAGECAQSTYAKQLD